MKKLPYLLALMAFFFSTAAFATDMGPAAGVTGLVDKDILEGWIIGIDYRSNHFQLLDPRGFQKRVTTKPGIIGDYRIGDKVHVEIDPDYQRARTIEKVS